ncbi:MAG: hypothetical protein AAFQ89_21805 [Cyanobacteria bacterium J06626_18]
MSTADYEIRLALPDDVAMLPPVEQVAASLFKPYLETTGLTEDSLNQVTAIADRSARRYEVLSKIRARL